jgi:ferrochelatase
LLAKKRAPLSMENYAKIGGGSPLLSITTQQSEAVKAALKKKGLDASTYIAMRYWAPFTEAALDEIIKDDITNLIILPLYPQYSISTTGSSLRILEE